MGVGVTFQTYVTPDGQPGSLSSGHRISNVSQLLEKEMLAFTSTLLSAALTTPPSLLLLSTAFSFGEIRGTGGAPK